MTSQYLSKNYVEETRFGFWFLRSHTWQHHVLRVAINDLRSLFTDPLPEAPVLLDASVDILFCHQTFHHLVEQHRALKEFYRVLKPGGYLLFAESTEAYIDTWVIRWLFRHPMHVQKSAEEYLQMLREQGFEFGPQNVSYPYLWWSRSRDFGLLERWGLRTPPPVGQREETLVNCVARKPLASATP